jgi:hypothetical protein
MPKLEESVQLEDNWNVLEWRASLVNEAFVEKRHYYE